MCAACERVFVVIQRNGQVKIDRDGHVWHRLKGREMICYGTMLTSVAFQTTKTKINLP
jgi:hypothetical protein